MSSVKAFELSSVIERVTLGEKIRIQIECIDYCGKKLYIGTSDSFVIEFNCENGRRTAQQQSQYKYLGYKKPIITLKCVFILERILCICDSNLLILNQEDLEPMSFSNKMKNVNALCFNENPSANNPFSVEICIARKKQLLICDLTSEKIIPLKEISITKPALALSMDGQYVCFGTDTNFFVINWENTQIQDLCACDTDILPIAKRITKEEFLISGPGSLGLFVKATGISDKPPLQWGTDLLAIAYSHPYILCLSDNALSVFSIVDQQLKQRIPFTGGTCLENFDGNILIASNDSVFSLVSVAWEKQIQMLLSNKKVKEALDLSQNWHQAGVSKENYDKFIKQIKQKAGFVEFSEKNYTEAHDLFIDGDLDVRELLYLYPDLLPNYENFTSIVKHGITDVNQLVNGDNESLMNFKLFLFDFLEELRCTDTEQYHNCQREIDTVLVILCSQMESFSPRLLDLLSDAQLKCDSQSIIKHLELNNRYHALALYYSQNNLTYEKALEIWMKLETKQYTDPLYYGLDCISQFMINLTDNGLLLKYIDFILERDQQLGSHVIINCKSNNDLDPDAIINHLQRFPDAEQKYLEHLVFDCKFEKEKFHTHLAMIYVEIVIKLIKNNTSESEVKESRDRLRHLLRTSSLYRVQLILGKAVEFKLHHECAILYGKMGEHEKALNILVQEIHDYHLAEQYCIEVSSQETDRKLRYRIFHTLLGIYLDLSQKNFQDFVTPALQLLNSEVTEFDAIEVLELIPQNWPINIIEKFINKSLRRSLHRMRQSMITKGLVTCESRIVKHEKLKTERTFIFLNEDRKCAICKTNIIEAEFIWYPTLGIALHPYCGKGLSNKI